MSSSNYNLMTISQTCDDVMSPDVMRYRDLILVRNYNADVDISYLIVCSLYSDSLTESIKRYEMRPIFIRCE